MRKSKALEKIRRGACVRVCGLGHYLPFFVRYAAHFKFDTIWLDLEHRAVDPREVQSLLALCQQWDIDCMVRTPTLERTGLYRFLEDGAAGLMVPFVSTGDIARHVVESVKFPPMGNRGIDGAGLDASFGTDAWCPDSTYTDDANRETFIVAQIETPEALTNLEEIAATPGIDVLFVGPADLGLRLGPDGDLDGAIESVAVAARKHGKAWGLPAGTAEQLTRYRQMDAQFLVNGGDFGLMKVLEDASATLDATVE